jgi:hypothetical protein
MPVTVGLVIWSASSAYIRRSMAGINGKRLRDKGGANFVDAVANGLNYCLNVDAQCLLELARSPDVKVQMTGMILVSMVWSLTDEALEAGRSFERLDCPWLPSPAQIAQYCYIRTAVMRYAGAPYMVVPAEEYIATANRIMTTEPKYQREEEEVKEWRRCLESEGVDVDKAHRQMNLRENEEEDGEITSDESEYDDEDEERDADIDELDDGEGVGEEVDEAFATNELD